jgi:hypothetical protein
VGADEPDCNNTITVVSYNTTGALAAVALQGSVVASVGLAALAFQPPDPTACNTPIGATTAGISGVTTLNQ